ncbi:ABC transporter substrate-binding protein [Candidatus Peregrinibacteria bacterium]|nr:ABC transporter substrate-binding protein [Candidatus Peregrinibacteria bacterium]
MKRPLALLALSTLLLTACKTSGDVIKIGFIGPLTGDAAAMGKDMLNGVQLAIDEVNAKGGVNGRKVSLIAEDARCTGGSDAASAAQKLVNVDKVVAIVGGLCSSETLAAAPIAEAAKIVLLSPGSSNPSISQAGDFVFRNYPSDALKAIAMAKYVKQQRYKKIAIISENTDYCTGLRDALVNEVGANLFVFNESVEPGTKDFRSLLTRLQNMEFDVFITNANSDGIIAVMLEQFRGQGFTQPILGADTADSQVVVDTGKSAEGMQFINVPTAGEGTPFEETLTNTVGKPQSSIAWAAYAYDAANILFEAIGNVGTDGSAIRDYLYKLPEYKGVVGTIHFDNNGDPVGIPYVVKEIKGGKIVKVKDIPLE